MSRAIFISLILMSAPVLSQTYSQDFTEQIEQLKIKASAVSEDLNVESMGVENLEAMRLRIEG